MKELIKKTAIFLLLLAVPSISLLLAVEKKVRVTAERAIIYAEAHKDSYRIDIVTKGTILTVFDSGEPKVTWYYVSFRSKRWNSQVTGFIQASMVEEASDKPEEKLPREKIVPKMDKPPEKIPIKEEVVLEAKPPEIKVEEELVASSLAPYRPYTWLPTLAEEKEPRVFMTMPQQKQMEEVQPKIEKPKVTPAKVEPKIEQVQVTESVGISSVLGSKSYVLPESRWEEEPRVFMVLERQPPKVKIAKLKPEEKREKTKEEEQVVPQITPQRPPRPKKPRIAREWSFLTMGAGYGPSGGSGLGGFIQLNTKTGFSFHAGAGLYPTSYFYSQHDWVKNQVLYSVGVKYFLPFKADWIRPYFDLQYGGISVEAVRLVTGIWYYQYTYENIQKNLYGPSFLAGIELKLGNIGLNGAIGLSYNTTEWDYWERDYFLTADLGLLIYLF